MTRAKKLATTGRPSKDFAIRSASKTTWPLRSPISVCRRTEPIWDSTRGAFLAHGEQRPHASLVSGPSGLDALSEPGFFLRQALVELCVVHRFDSERFLLAPEEGRVVTGPRRQTPAIQLDNPSRQRLEKDAVVRHEQHGPRKVGQTRFEPLHRLDVEMVGRLIEEEQIGLPHQCARQQDASLPTAGERAHGDIAGDLESGERHLHLLIGVPRVSGDRAESFGHNLERPALVGKEGVLREPADAQPGLVPDRPFLRRHVAADNLEECGLTCAVPPDHADTFAGFDPEAGVI